jgi:diadenosine tetraphosphatase ApaH/serine/threonine PP2A family protein phosphatase
MATFDYQGTRPIALMGGVYGNLPALRACLADAREEGTGFFAFLGDITGCCGHSDEAISLVRQSFDAIIAGNHEQQAAAGALVCGCGYSSADDEKYGCLAHSYAMDSLTEEHRDWLAALPEQAIIETAHGAVLICHGSPERTNEFLYESLVEDQRLEAWLHECEATGLVCTHTGLPWLRSLGGSRFAVNCGVVGKSDHDGDPAVHYALLRQEGGLFEAEIRRVAYDHESWARQLEEEGVDHIFVTPVRTGTWTTGVASMPAWEKERRRTHPQST